MSSFMRNAMSRLQIAEVRRLTVEALDKIDNCGFSEDKQTFLLFVIDRLPWNERESEHLALLHKKLNTYLRFLDIEAMTRFPEVKDCRQIIIEIVGQFPMSERAAHFIDGVRTFIANSSAYQLRFSVGGPGKFIDSEDSTMLEPEEDPETTRICEHLSNVCEQLCAKLKPGEDLVPTLFSFGRSGSAKQAPIRELAIPKQKERALTELIPLFVAQTDPDYAALFMMVLARQLRTSEADATDRPAAVEGIAICVVGRDGRSCLRHAAVTRRPNWRPTLAWSQRITHQITRRARGEVFFALRDGFFQAMRLSS
jgi:hypothetical protein